MIDMITYIFSSLRSSEKRLDAITRAVRKQGNFNAKFAVFAAVTTANLIIIQIEQKDQAMRIRKLEKEIEDLKHPEGE